MLRRIATCLTLAALLPLYGIAAAPPRVSVAFDPALGALHGRLLVFLTQKSTTGELEPVVTTAW